MADSEKEKYQPSVCITENQPPLLSWIGDLICFSDRRWIGCLRTDDDTIFLPGGKMISTDDKTVRDHDYTNIDQISMMYRPEGAYLTQPGFFLALDGYIQHDPTSGYSVKIWRSNDNLHTISEDNSPVYIPSTVNSPAVNISPFCFSRSLVELSDGHLLATAYGCFEDDRLLPEDRHSQIETPFKTRAFLLASHDRGVSWTYYTTIARPIAGDPVGEGFNEPTMVRLCDGRLLCVLRTGHYTPLYSCWSSDEGITWTEPLYTGLERGCWPCLTRLADGRLAMAFGQRFPAGWSRVTPQGDWPRYEPIWPGVGLVRLAISADGTGQTWDAITIGRGMGSCYPTIYEIAPNLLFCQVDGWFWRMQLTPRNAKGRSTS